MRHVYSFSLKTYSQRFLMMSKFFRLFEDLKINRIYSKVFYNKMQISYDVTRTLQIIR